MFLRGFVKLKKFQKSEKNAEVGGWVKLQLGFLFFLNMVFFCVVFLVVHVSQKLKKIDRRVGGCSLDNLDKTPKASAYEPYGEGLSRGVRRVLRHFQNLMIFLTAAL